MDREKVIKELSELHGSKETMEIIEQAISMLKEPGTVTVKEDKINKCECGETVCRYWHPKFCGFCGRELLWY